LEASDASHGSQRTSSVFMKQTWSFPYEATWLILQPSYNCRYSVPSFVRWRGMLHAWLRQRLASVRCLPLSYCVPFRTGPYEAEGSEQAGRLMEPCIGESYGQQSRRCTRSGRATCLLVAYSVATISSSVHRERPLLLRAMLTPRVRTVTAAWHALASRRRLALPSAALSAGDTRGTACRASLHPARRASRRRGGWPVRRA
jgi:hypothetical protein